ncbi:MAG: hypothetical protein ICV80_18820 [Microcoleus sp. T1-bin1]|nr:hypothetical protein [Microcoleus sp. T1-bin1]
MLFALPGNVTTAATLTLTPSPSPIKGEQGGFIQGEKNLDVDERSPVLSRACVASKKSGKSTWSGDR